MKNSGVPENPGLSPWSHDLRENCLLDEMYLRQSLVDWDVVDFDRLHDGRVIQFLVNDPIGTPANVCFAW
jgi:hypothetical protein